jgi:hypothetical protein
MLLLTFFFFLLIFCHAGLVSSHCKMLNSLLANGADGISDIEGKAARVAASELGIRVSFNGAAGARET